MLDVLSVGSGLDHVPARQRLFFWEAQVYIVTKSEYHKGDVNLFVS